MECPKCNYLRQEKDSIVPDWQCPSCGVAYAKVKRVRRFVKVRMTSGQEIQFDHIKLYELALARKLDDLRQTAATNLSGYSSGLGFWGDMEWVAAGSLVTGIIDGAVSRQREQQGMAQLSQASRIAKQLRGTAAYVPVSSIENIEYPDIGLWKAKTFQGRDVIHVASNYIFVRVDGKESALFWDKIEQYELIEDS